jgi:hypothetical protein
VEFAWDNGRLYILQCRSLTIWEEVGKVELPEDTPSEDIVFTNRGGVCGGAARNIEYVVYVDPRVYNNLNSYEEKTAAARVVGRLNRALADKRYALFGPGRWGSNDINLGVRVGYADINNTLILGEVAFAEGGQTPEVSHGTHFFSDLVEARIIPVAVYPDLDDAVFREDFFTGGENHLTEFAPQDGDYKNLVRVVHVPERDEGRFLHVYQDGEQQKGMGILAPEQEMPERQ